MANNPATSGAPAAAAKPSRSYPIRTELRHRFAIIRALDAVMLSRLHVPPRVIYLLTALAAAFFGLVRIDFLDAGDIPGRSLVVFVYTGSAAFLAIAFASGLLSRISGIVFVTVFSVCDLLIWAFRSTNNYFYSEPTPVTLGGRLISFALLGILVIVIPAIQRSTNAEFAGRRIGRLFLGPAVASLAVAVMVMGWVTAAPYLLRPVFRNVSVPVEEITLLQNHDVQIAVVAAVMAFVAALLIAPRTDVTALPVALFPIGRWTRHLGPLRRVIGYALLIGFVAGIIKSWLDVAILAGAALVAEIGALIIPRRLPIARLTSQLSVAGRVVVALVASFLIALGVSVVAPNALAESEFFPLVLAVALGIIAFRWLLTGSTSATVGAHRLGEPSTTAVTLGALALLVLTSLALPASVFADNCENWADCRAGHGLVAAICFWLLLVAAPFLGNWLWGWIKGIFVDELAVEAALSPEGAAAQRGAFDMMRAQIAQTVLRDTGDYDEYQRILNQSDGDLNADIKAGKYNGILGYDGSYSGGGGGGFSVGGQTGCLPTGTLIETPVGAMPVELLRMGQPIWTLGPGYRRLAAAISAVQRTRVPATHTLIEVTLNDGRRVRASGRHPLADGRRFEEISPGQLVDGSTVLRSVVTDYGEPETFDILPDGESGCYWVGGIPLASTIHSPTTVTSRGNAVSRSSRRASASNRTRSSMRTPVTPSR